MSPDGKLIALGMRGRTGVYSADSGQLLMEAKSPREQLAQGYFLLDSKRLVTLDDRDIAVVEIPSGNVVERYPRRTDGYWNERVCDRRYLMSSANASIVDVLSLETGRRVQTLRNATSLSNMDCDRSGRRVVTGAHDGHVRIWNHTDGGMIAQFRAHTRSVEAYFIDDDKRLMTSGTDGTVAIWELDEETRPPNEVARIVGCRARWRLVGRDLVRRAEATECG
jgi:WD40 repeat protein